MDKVRNFLELIGYVFMGAVVAFLMDLIPENIIVFNKENQLLVFIIFELLAAANASSYLSGLLAAGFSAILFNYLYIPPFNSLQINDSNDVILLFGFLATSFIACFLSNKSKKQIELNKGFSDFSRVLLSLTGKENIIQYSQKYIFDNTGLNCTIESDYVELKDDDFEIIGANGVMGAIKPNDEKKLNSQQKMFLTAVSNQLGNAFDREMQYHYQEQQFLEIEKQKTLNNMLRSISHDLRTPLTGIIGASQFLREHDELLLEDRKELLNDIHEQASWLIQSAENILNMSKIETGILQLNKNLDSVDDLVYEAIQHVVDLDKRNFQYHLPEQLVMMNVDGKLIIQVIINLLNNAVKYTDVGDSILIEVSKQEGYVLFNVKDSGKGIPVGSEQEIFEEFVTYSGEKNDSFKGIGLGLAICKAIIQAHGGDIYGKNNEDKGACFTFSIPLEKEVLLHE